MRRTRAAIVAVMAAVCLGGAAMATADDGGGGGGGHGDGGHEALAGQQAGDQGTGGQDGSGQEGDDMQSSHLIDAPTRNEADRRHAGQANTAAAAAAAAGTGIAYHGGPVMTGTTHLYTIWYGNWPTTSTTPTILNDLMRGVGGSPYFNINTTYTNAAGGRVANAMTLAGSTTDSYSQGRALTDAGVGAVVTAAVRAGRLPLDASGVYLVLTSGDVSETSGFLTQYCGWHTYGVLNRTPVKYAFIGDPSRNLRVCTPQTTRSPNGNPAADAMASVLAHEVEETVTDPQLNAWYDSLGNENADKCAWTYGALFTAPNGSRANLKFGTRNFLIQQNWVNSGTGGCVLKW